MSVSLTAKILNQYLTNVFVESGSFEGGGIQLALDCGFDHVRSVELDPKYYNMCMARFIDNPGVKLYRGDTALMFWEVIKDLTEPVTFWLDGHYQYTVEGIDKVPLIAELNAIARHPIKTHRIIIDDRRLMGTGFWGNVTQSMVTNTILQINPAYKLKFIDTVHAASDIIAAQL